MALPHVHSWSPLLSDSRAISKYMENHSSSYVDKEMIEEYFLECEAQLELVAISEIRPGPPEANIADPRKDRKYSAMPLESAPPIILMNGVVEDGHHRLRQATSRGATHLLCYVVREIPEPEEIHALTRSPRP